MTMISIMRLKTTKTESKIVCLINLALSVSLIVCANPTLALPTNFR